jgi:hypothetical protein
LLAIDDVVQRLRIVLELLSSQGSGTMIV